MCAFEGTHDRRVDVGTHVTSNSRTPGRGSLRCWNDILCPCLGACESRIAMSHISGRAGWWKPPSPVLVRASGEQSPGATRHPSTAIEAAVGSLSIGDRCGCTISTCDQRSIRSTRRSTAWGIGQRTMEAFLQRGDVTLWLSADAMCRRGATSPSGRPDAPKTVLGAVQSMTALQAPPCLPVALAPSRRLLAVGLVVDGCRSRSPRPHHARPTKSVSRGVNAAACRRDRRIQLIVDSTGLSIVGEGECPAVKHGGRGHRGWKKLHLAVDRVSVIVAHALTEPTVDDATIGDRPHGDGRR